MKAFTTIVALLLLGAVAMATPAEAETVEFKISFNKIVRGEPGSTHRLATEAVPADLQGRTCPVTILVHNPRSTHPNSDTAVRSGSTSVLAFDVEREAGWTDTVTGSLTFGVEWYTEVTLGADGVYSGGDYAVARCEVTQPTTTTTTEETTTTASTTTTEAPTTTMPSETTTTVAVCQEDEPCWDCETMGNRICEVPTTVTPVVPVTPVPVITVATTTTTTAVVPIPSGVPTGLGEDESGVNGGLIATVFAIGLALSVLGYTAWKNRSNQ